MVNDPGAESAVFALVGRLRWLQLDGEWVLFGAQAGALLQADALTAAVCVLLEEGSASLHSLAERMAASMQTDASGALVAHIAGVLDELQDSGLVQCLDR